MYKRQDQVAKEIYLLPCAVEGHPSPDAKDRKIDLRLVEAICAPFPDLDLLCLPFLYRSCRTFRPSSYPNFLSLVTIIEDLPVTEKRNDSWSRSPGDEKARRAETRDIYLGRILVRIAKSRYSQLSIFRVP